MSNRYLIIEHSRRKGKSIAAKLASDPKIAEYILAKYGQLYRPTVEMIQEAMRELGEETKK